MARLGNIMQNTMVRRQTEKDSSEKVIHDYYEEERRFAEFSKKALHIRNNDCDAEEFKDFP